MKARGAALIVLAAALGARADEYQAEPDQVLATLDARVGGAEISAVSRTLEWSALSTEEGAAQLHLSFPLESFAADGRRLAPLLRTSDALDLEGTVSGSRFTGLITVHGVQRPLEMPFALTRSGPQMIVQAAFTFAPGDFGIALPGVVAVEVFARLRASPRAVLSGGIRRESSGDENSGN